MSNPETNKISIITFLNLHLILFFYSISSCLSKYASQYEFLSSGFVLTYGGVVLILAVYAVLWQQVLKKMPLFIAFANKSIVVIWGMIFGKVFFDESLSLYSLIGAILISAGVFMVVKKDE